MLMLFQFVILILSLQSSISFTINHSPKQFPVISKHAVYATTTTANSANNWNWDSIVNSFSKILSPNQGKSSSGSISVEVPVIDYTIYDKEINSIKEILNEATISKNKYQPEDLIEKLTKLEKLMRAKNKLDEGKTSVETSESLTGAWKLIYTTGTVDTQKKIGKVNYFPTNPIYAMQTFDNNSKNITNGIYWTSNNFPLLKFYGKYEWNEKPRRVDFDFDEIAVFNFQFSLPKGGAAKIGSSTGLGSDNNVKNINKGRKPFFNWISADENIATARGGGGGLALWKRVN
eukprot:gene6619-9086_t